MILTFGASSAASETVRPSKDALTGEIILWFGNPCFTAIVEKTTMEDLFFFKFSLNFLIIYIIGKKFKSKLFK